MATIKPVTYIDVLTFFQSTITSEQSRTTENYAKAVASLDKFAKEKARALPFEAEDSHPALSYTTLQEWANGLLLQGYSLKVVHYYDKVFSALYNKGVKAGKFPKTDIFKSLQNKLEEFEGCSYDYKQAEGDYGKLQHLAHTATSSSNDCNTLNKDILLTCIFAGKQTLNEIGKLKKDDIESIIPELHDIIERNIAATRKYVFNLGQSPLTDRQLTLVVEKAATAALASCGIKVGATLKDTLANLWAFAALKSGIDAPTIIGTLGYRPANNPIFALCEITPVDASARQKILSAVAKSILVNSKEWFVMRLRPMVKYADIAKRIAAIEPSSRPTLFYPCEEIQKRVNNKLVYARRPVIPDIVFFKARISDVLPLFRIIGDKAWCYTTEGRNSGKYAIVPKAAMETFQRAIGKFTSDYEVGAIGTITPQKGDTIKIIGGIFSGNDGTIDKIEEGADACDTIYRVVIVDGQGIEWRVNVDSRLIDSNNQQS
jgi:hypothetical protein